MNQKRWNLLGLTEPVIDELYRRGRKYAEDRIVQQHREDAVQHGMCCVLRIVDSQPDNYPETAELRLNYLSVALFREAMRYVSRKLSPDTNIPTIPE